MQRSNSNIKAPRKSWNARPLLFILDFVPDFGTETSLIRNELFFQGHLVLDRVSTSCAFQEV